MTVRASTIGSSFNGKLPAGNFSDRARFLREQSSVYKCAKGENDG